MKKQGILILILTAIGIAPLIAAENEGAIGKALYSIGMAAHLRGAILSTECKAYLTPAVLGWWGTRDYPKLTTELSARLSPQARAEMLILASSSKYQEQKKQSAHVHITETLENYRKRDAPLAFACGYAFARVSDAMLRAEGAINEASSSH